MRLYFTLAAFALALPVALSSGQPPADKLDAEAPAKDQYADLSRLLHKVVVKQAPREFEQKFDWGKTIPVPPQLRLPNLPRTYIKVGNRMELPHGTWRRIHVKLQDPDKDLKIKVKDLKKLDKAGYRMVIDSEALLRCDGELNQWLNGLLLFKAAGQADATIDSTMVCDVDVTVNLKKFPPEIKVEPKIIELWFDLKDFKLNELGGTLQGEKVRQIGNELMRELLRDLIKASEPIVKQQANEAIAQSLKENQGKFSAAELLKAAPK